MFTPSYWTAEEAYFSFILRHRVTNIDNLIYYEPYLLYFYVTYRVVFFYWNSIGKIETIADTGKLSNRYFFTEIILLWLTF